MQRRRFHTFRGAGAGDGVARPDPGSFGKGHTSSNGHAGAGPESEPGPFADRDTRELPVHERQHVRVCGDARTGVSIVS
jgi:hypothetical protein